MGCTPPGSSVHGEFSRQKCWSGIILCALSSVWLSVTLWSVACQGPLSVGFSIHEYWNGLPFPTPGNLSHPGIKLTFLMSLTLAGRFFTTSITWEAPLLIREMQVKTIMRYYYLTPVRMTIIKKSAHNKCLRWCGEKETLLDRCWECKLVQPLWRET